MVSSVITQQHRWGCRFEFQGNQGTHWTLSGYCILLQQSNNINFGETLIYQLLCVGLLRGTPIRKFTLVRVVKLGECMEKHVLGICCFIIYHSSPSCPGLAYILSFAFLSLVLFCCVMLRCLKEDPATMSLLQRSLDPEKTLGLVDVLYTAVFDISRWKDRKWVNHKEPLVVASSHFMLHLVWYYLSYYLDTLNNV